MNRCLSLVIVTFCLIQFSFAQTSDKPEHLYLYEQNHVQEYCWRESREADIKIPEEWKSESAVILLAETLYEAKARGKTSCYLSFITRYKILIQDEASLEKFSTLRSGIGAHGAYSLWGRQKSFIGAKLIKPDGKEVLIDNEEFIEENDQKKLAVPGLEIGDILDFYMYTYDYIGISSPDFYPVIDKDIIAGSFPILSFKYKVITDASWKVYFSTGEIGPEIKEQVIGSKKKTYHFEIKDEKIPSITHEPWSAPYRTQPYIKLIVKFSKGNLKDRSTATRLLRINQVPEKEIIDSYRSYIIQDNVYSAYLQFEKYLSKNDKESLSKEEMLEEYYYFLRHDFISRHYLYDQFNKKTYKGQNYRVLDDIIFAGNMIHALDELDIPYEFVVGVNRNVSTLEEVIHPFETGFFIIALLDEPVYLTNPTPFTKYNELPFGYEDTQAYVIYKDDYIGKLNTKIKTLRQSNADSNNSSYTSALEINPNIDKVTVSTDVIVKGYPINQYKSQLTDWIEMIWEENDYYNSKKWGNMDNPKKNFKVQMEEFMSDRETERKENFEQTAKNHFDLDEINLVDYNTSATANKQGENEFHFSFDVELENLVQKIGDKYILKIGDLVRNQISFNEDDLKRRTDIYMTYARTFNYTINVKIPEGYEVIGLDNLQLDIENSTGYVKSKGVFENGMLCFVFSKQYKNNVEKAENWELMKEFLIPASLVSSKEVILQKK